MFSNLINRKRASADNRATNKLFGTIRVYCKDLGSLAPVALATTFLPMLGSSILILLAPTLGHWLRANWEIGLPLYLLGVLFFCGLALLPTNVVGAMAGWVFGFDLGIAVLMAGIVGAASISFLIHSRIAGDKLPHTFDAHPKSKAIYEALVVGQSFWRTTLIISLLRLSPAMPFALTNFLMAAARVPLKSFVVGTLVGMLPRSSAVVFVGAGVSELTFDDGQNSWLIVFGIIATIISIIVIGRIAKHALERLTAKQTPVCEAS
jgi:uncharacterized membrane protein YdjX (TVP38/TMEM64 family)